MFNIAEYAINISYGVVEMGFSDFPYDSQNFT
jgi:hypothetical protein